MNACLNCGRVEHTDKQRAVCLAWYAREVAAMIKAGRRRSAC